MSPAEVPEPEPGGEWKLDFLTPSAKPGHLGRLGHYEVMEVIGRGGMGVVLKAFDEKLHRVVAIKVMAPALASSATARKRLIREAQAAAAVRNEHVIDIHAVEEAGRLPYLVMEYVSGLSLQERLDQEGPLEPREILRIGVQVASGLAAAHAQGLVHRDIKPANILLENGVQRRYHFYTTWSDNRLSDAFHTNQPDVPFAKIPVGWAGTATALAALASPDGTLPSRPAVADRISFARPLGAAVAAVADPGAPHSRESSWSGLAVDAYFIDLARTVQTTGGAPNGDTAFQHTFGPAPPALPVAREPVVVPQARLTDTPTPALARRASQRPADKWATDGLISGVLWWEGEAGM